MKNKRWKFNYYGMPTYLPPDKFCFKTYSDWLKYPDEFYTGNIIDGKVFSCDELFFWWRVDDLKRSLTDKYKHRGENHRKE